MGDARRRNARVSGGNGTKDPKEDVHYRGSRKRERETRDSCDRRAVAFFSSGSLFRRRANKPNGIVTSRICTYERKVYLRNIRSHASPFILRAIQPDRAFPLWFLYSYIKYMINH